MEGRVETHHHFVSGDGTKLTQRDWHRLGSHWQSLGLDLVFPCSGSLSPNPCSCRMHPFAGIRPQSHLGLDSALSSAGSALIIPMRGP